VDQIFNLVIVAVLLICVWMALRPNYVFVIRIEHGAARSDKGKVTPEFLQHVADVCRARDVMHGWVGGVARGGRVRLAFSGSIPRDSRQQLRNVWAFQR
jgi:hypothetical protein